MAFLKALLLEVFRPVICLVSGIRRFILFKKLAKQSRNKVGSE